MKYKLGTQKFRFPKYKKVLFSVSLGGFLLFFELGLNTQGFISGNVRKYKKSFLFRKYKNFFNFRATNIHFWKYAEFFSGEFS